MATQPNPAGQAPAGQPQPYAMPQEAQDQAPVVNIPASAVPPGMAIAPHPYEQQLTELVVDGQTQAVNHAKLKELAQKGVSADARYQEAAAKSREADEAIKFKADFDLLAETGDVSAFRRAGAAAGLTGEEVEEAARLVYEQMGEGNLQQGQPSPDNDNFDENSLYAAPQGTRGGNVEPSAGGGPVTLAQQIAILTATVAKMQGHMTGKKTGFGDLSDDLQTVVGDAEQIRVNKIIQNVLDSDDVLAYHMSSYDSKGQQAIREMIGEKIEGRLDAHNGKFGDGTRILNEVIPEVKKTLEALGTPNRSTPQMGLGPAPGGQSGADIYPRRQPDHVPSTEAGFEEHIAETLRHNEFKANQGK